MRPIDDEYAGKSIFAVEREYAAQGPYGKLSEMTGNNLFIDMGFEFSEDRGSHSAVYTFKAHPLCTL